MQVDLSRINVVAELERIGYKFKSTGEDELRCRCPFHEDEKPSCAVNVAKRQFKCHAAGCGASGDFLTFLAKALNTTRRVVFEDLSKRYELTQATDIDGSVVEKWHQDLQNATALLRELYARGVTDALIREYRLGHHNGRVTIPIPDEHGRYVNVRKYLPGAPGPEKMRNLRGHGQIRLYPLKQLKYERVVLCGGEIKAIVAASILNAKGIGAVTATAGEGNWAANLTGAFKGKRVYVCYDIDTAGVSGANSVCARLRGVAAWVGRVVLPLNPGKYPHGDVNDWVGREGATAKDFASLLDSTEEWEPSDQNLYDAREDPAALALDQSVLAKYTGKRLKTRAIVSAMDTAPYVVPKTVSVVCDRNQDGCSMCPVYATTPDDKGVTLVSIPPESPGILEMVAAPKSAQRDALLTALRVPRCKNVEFRPVEWYNVDDIRLSPQLEISQRSVEHVMQPALCVGHSLELNESYEFVGRMFPHPQTQQSILLISEYRPTKDALATYAPTASDLRALEVFQPREWTEDGLAAKLADLYCDLEANVTRIFMRRDLHLAIDLAYHSVLLIPFDGRVIKGWTEVLVVGDSSQGKSETTLQLMRHYGLGEKVECKNATVAGLLGGLQQLGSRWFVTWGVIPTHDKRLVVLEELKGTSVEVIAKLTDMRSSGVAEIPKIEKRRTHARTRLIALSNPRSDRPLSAHNFGVEAVKDLVGGLEDIRRFDMALLVSSSEIDPKTLNTLQRHRPKVEPVHTSNLCRRCVLWAWTREASQVLLDDAALVAILDESTRLCSMFTDLVPLVDRGSMRHKLTRLSVALAARTYSCDKDPTKLRVRECHVRYVAKYLERVYSSPVFGYLDFSNAVLATQTLLQPDDIRARLLQAPFPSDLVKQILHTSEIELRDLCDWCGWDKGEAIQMLSFLVRKHALQRSDRCYHKTAPFIEMLKELAKSPDLVVADRPSYIKEEF